jgi:hypothetical protein
MTKRHAEFVVYSNPNALTALHVVDLRQFRASINDAKIAPREAGRAGAGA